MPHAAAEQHRAATPLDATAVLAWYDRHARSLPWRIAPADRQAGIAPDPYRIWLSEVMLQQTTVAAVGKYFARFTALWPDVRALAVAPLDQVLVEWAGLGYYARARNLHACAIAVVERFDGVFPRLAAELATLPGIGAYTSAAIAAITADERVPVLDGNVERVLARYYALPVPVAVAKEVLRATLAEAVPSRAGDFAQAMMDLGATICAPRATLCMLCPLRDGCAAFAESQPLAYPVKRVKPERPTRYGHAFVMTDPAGDIFLRSRAATGLLAKMTEVPSSAFGDEASEPDFPVAANWRRVGQVVHVFTHFRLELDVWAASVEPQALGDGGWWAEPAALGGEALPSLFRKVLAEAGF